MLIDKQRDDLKAKQIRFKKEAHEERIALDKRRKALEAHQIKLKLSRSEFEREKKKIQEDSLTAEKLEKMKKGKHKQSLIEIQGFQSGKFQESTNHTKIVN